MRIARNTAAAGALLALILAGLAFWTRSTGALAAVQVPAVFAAAVLYGAGFLLFNAFWAYLLCRVPTAHGTVVFRPTGFARAWRVGLLSLAGLFTPMNLGTDVLRSLLGRRYLGLNVPLTAAASVVARECKLHVTLVLLPMAAALTVTALDKAGSRLGAALAGMLALGFLLLAFRSDAGIALARALGVGQLADATRALHGQLGWRRRTVTYLALAGGLAAEWLALQLCFEAVHIPATPDITLGAYAALYVLARAPVLPLGIGVTEAGGLAWLGLIHVPVEQAGALILIWSAIRIGVPHALAAAALVTFLAEPRR